VWCANRRREFEIAQPRRPKHRPRSVAKSFERRVASDEEREQLIFLAIAAGRLWGRAVLPDRQPERLVVFGR
jgi:hypothetical protein